MTNKTYFTLPVVAKRLGLHRTTLLRLEQRGVVPKAKWATRPFNGRIYTEEDIKATEKALDEYMKRKPGGKDGVQVDDNDVINPELLREE